MSAPAPLEVTSPRHSVNPAFETLKVVIVGTPKTGNTWLTHLFAELYDLPQVRLEANWRSIDWNALGPRWVGQQHFQPEPELKQLAEEQGIVFVTPIRHPADAFVSLRHYTDRRDDRDIEPEDVQSRRPDYMLEDGQGVFGDATRYYLEHGFYLKVHLSIYWLRMGWSFGVRYEDLWLHPVATLRTLTQGILPTDDDKIRRAVCACEIGVMKEVVDKSAKLVRKGGINGWREALPAELQAVFQERAPYPQQLASLGYSMDLDDPANAPVSEPSREDNPFAGGRFANGVPVAPVQMHLYFDGIKDDPNRWTDSIGLGEGSFYQWLMSPAAADPQRDQALPLITEFAYAFYQLRQDLPAVFPDPFGEHRREFADWFMHSAIREFEFDDSFILPVVESWARGIGE